MALIRPYLTSYARTVLCGLVAGGVSSKYAHYLRRSCCSLSLVISFLARCDAFLARCDAFLARFDAFLVRCDAFLVRCDAFLARCYAFLVRCYAFLVRCDAFLVRCDAMPFLPDAMPFLSDAMQYESVAKVMLVVHATLSYGFVLNICSAVLLWGLNPALSYDTSCSAIPLIPISMTMLNILLGCDIRWVVLWFPFYGNGSSIHFVYTVLVWF